MLSLLNQHFGEVLSFILGLVGGSLATFTIQSWKSNSAKSGGVVVDQSGAKAGRPCLRGDF